MTQADQLQRLRLYMCSLGNKGAALSTKLKYNIDCCCEIKTLELLVMYWMLLECYDPDNTDECLTAEEIEAIWNDISCKTGLCFAPIGSTYSLSTNSQRITQSNQRRITEEGNNRVIEDGVYVPPANEGINYWSIEGDFIVS